MRPDRNPSFFCLLAGLFAGGLFAAGAASAQAPPVRSLSPDGRSHVPTPDRTLASFGNQTIGVKEFLAAYGKNNPNPERTTKAYRNYLDLYLRYRLKVQAALDEHLDTLPGQQSELQNFRNQIADQFTVDSPTLKRLTDEAFSRSQVDVRVSVIFVALPKNPAPADTAKAWNKIREAEKFLRKTGSFAETALAFSEDPFVKTNQGDLGFVTVFELPYLLESAAYRPGTGHVSQILRTSGGYALVKKTAERKAVGRIRVAQILLSWPYQAAEPARTETKRRADSLWKALEGGADFADLARRFSGDNLTYQIGGLMPEFGAGRYDSAFEAAAFSLPRDGALSAPFPSSFGMHILKRINRVPPPSGEDGKAREDMRNRVMADPRIAVARQQMVKIMERQTGLRQTGPPVTALLTYTDSLLQYNRAPAHPKIEPATPLFQLPGKNYLVSDWLTYRKNLGRVPAGVSAPPEADLLEAYRAAILGEYYRNHLENYNPVFARQLEEFRAGNLLFEIMQRQVWEKAAVDSNGLRTYFNNHARNYWWTPSADVIQFTAGDAVYGQRLRENLTGRIAAWRKVVDSLGPQVQADSGRVELRQIPGSAGVVVPGFTAGTRGSDGSAQFAYLIRNHPGSEARSFSEARGMAINDYQGELENRWIAELKKKYPVRIDETALNGLPKK